jgi:hypothetical protein
MNAPGNRHDLALRILPIWLKGHGAKVRVFEDDVHQERLMRNIAAERPKYLLISLAVTDQCGDVAEIAKTVQAASGHPSEDDRRGISGEGWLDQIDSRDRTPVEHQCTPDRIVAPLGLILVASMRL